MQVKRTKKTVIASTVVAGAAMAGALMFGGSALAAQPESGAQTAGKQVHRISPEERGKIQACLRDHGIKLPEHRIDHRGDGKGKVVHRVKVDSQKRQEIREALKDCGLPVPDGKRVHVTR